MLSYIKEQLIDEASKMGLALQILPPEEAMALRHNLAARFGAGRYDEVHWDDLADYAARHDADVMRILAGNLTDGPVYLFADRRDEESVFALPGSMVAPLLDECALFIFYVADPALTFLICENDHDVIMGAGAAKAWVENAP